MKNKKAQFVLPFQIILFAIALITLVLFFLVKRFRVIILGVGLLIFAGVMINKSKNKKLKGVVTLLAIGGGIFLVMTGGVLQSIGGTSVLSIDNVQIRDNGAKIRVTAVAGSGAEALSINWGIDQLNSYLEGTGYEATQSVTGTLVLEDTYVDFGLNKLNSENYISTRVQKVGIFSSCPSTYQGHIFNSILPSSSIGRVCYYTIGVGTNSVFNGQGINHAIVDINIDGATGTLDPSNGGTFITLNDGKTKIKWVGNLVNSISLSPPNYQVLFHQSEYKKLLSPNSYSTFKSKANSFASCVGGSGSNLWTYVLGNLGSVIGGGASYSTIESCVNNFNTQVSTIINQDYLNTYKNSISAKDVYFTNSGMRVELGIPNQFPVFTIDLDAESVGIIELSGDPQIVKCFGNKQISSGDTTSGNVQVKNIGGSEGLFVGSLTCTGDTSGTVAQAYVNPGETKNIAVQVSGLNSNPGITTESCAIKITDQNSGDSDSCNFNLEIEYQSGIVCNPSSVICVDSDTKRVCASDGLSYEDISCPSEEVCEVQGDGSGKCVSEGSTGGGTGVTLTCKWYESKLIQNKVIGKGPLGIGKLFGLTDTVKVEKCVISNGVWIVGLGILVLGIMLYLFIPQNGKRKKKK